jgi:hypothetical protein
MDMEQRIRMAAESILENESLREGLDDDAATVLLEWGISCAKQIASETVDLEDEIDAEEAVYPRMFALRMLLRDVTELCGETVEPARQTELLEEIAAQIPVIYGPIATSAHPDAAALADFIAAQPRNSAQLINDLRALIEAKPNTE